MAKVQVILPPESVNIRQIWAMAGVGAFETGRGAGLAQDAALALNARC